MTFVYEVAARFTTYDAALTGGIIVALLGLFFLHGLDRRRFQKMLHPPARRFPVGADMAADFVRLTLNQVAFEQAGGTSASWKLAQAADDPWRIEGKMNVRPGTANPNVMSWLIDIIDKGHKPVRLTMRIDFRGAEDGTEVAVQYDAPELLDWSRLAQVIAQNNRWVDAAMLRACAFSGETGAQ